MEREISAMKLIGFGGIFLYSLTPLVIPAIYAQLAPFAAVVVGVYVILCIVCGWLKYVNHQIDYSLLISAGIFFFATALALFWPTALGYLIYFGLTSLAYLIPALNGFRKLAKK